MLNKILIGIFVAVFFAAIIYIPKAIRVYNVVHLFDEDKIVKNFINMNKVFPTTPIKSSGKPHLFQTKALVWNRWGFPEDFIGVVGKTLFMFIKFFTILSSSNKWTTL